MDKIPCGKCGELIDQEKAESCFYCLAYLCYICWDEFGHCGHPEADAMNEHARSIQQPTRPITIKKE